MEIDSALKKLHAKGIREVRHAHTFKGYRRNALGETVEVTVEILESFGAGLDRGPRYTVTVTDEFGRRATGNGDDDLDVALATIHWNDLDRRVASP